jgi:hypothetical protein
MGSLLGLIGRGLGLISVVLVVALNVRWVADALNVPAFPATIIEWTCAAAAGAVTWRWWRRARRELASEHLAEERAAGEALRHNDPDRHRDFLNGATETLAVTDPDRFVGQRVAALPRGEVRIRWRGWKASTSQQAEAVDELTQQLERAILIHTLEDGSAELVGSKEDVGFRYRVDSSGGVTLLSKDDKLVTSSRQARRIGRTGLLMFMGSFAIGFALHPSGHVPGRLVPVMIVGFLLCFLYLAGDSGPKRFVKEGEWHQYGKGWD